MPIEDDPAFHEWRQHINEELVPMIESSNVVLSLCPPAGKVDAKFAVELGLSLMLNKPIILIVSPGVKVADKLVLVADDIFEADVTTPEGREELAAKIAAHAEQYREG